jgi:two-component system NtrC family sensor kinase
VYQFSAVAADDVALLQINRQEFFAVISKHHDAFNSILIALYQKMYLQNQLKQEAFLQRLDKLNKELATAKNDVEVRTTELIKQEKLASLGLLSAGIAHELQNPLNFVNNFAELSGEMISDIKSTTNTSEKEALLREVAGNIDKIKQHGMRASRIIKRIVTFSRETKAILNLPM